LRGRRVETKKYITASIPWGVVVVLGLLAAIAYGLGDFAGGFASRKHSAVTVLLWAYPIGAVLMALLLPVFGGTPDGRTFLFGALGGCAGMMGVLLMYSLMAIAPMNIISPVTAVLAAIVPVIVGVALGERPSALAWAGMAVGIAAVMLVSRTTEDHPHGRIAPKIIALACVAGIGFGLYFVFLARAGNDSGLWPLVISRTVAAILILPVAASSHAFVRVERNWLYWAIGAGVCDATANLCFLLASRHGLLSVAAVLTSLYPAVTVILAVTVLHEHVSRAQRAGLALAVTSIVLITI
jgi:drug/metabolite transporter (DMT)-like permease